jgi:hypothetical protein
MIGGNQSDEVNQEAVPTSNIVGIVRPPYQGGKVSVRESAPLPGGSVGGVGAPGGSVGSTEGAVSGSPTGAGGQERARGGVTTTLNPLSSLISTSAPLPEGYGSFQLG